ncbi:hypothetical protein E2986_03305 [Frieseomelitta varia]|uniref:Titin n=1 Tax=Frieseomelitta varia TaxID=561572 RepID=A0A833SD88_9HYME|nr:hypothetical protein E2986_03305 [Frieseomelitta varia]
MGNATTKSHYSKSHPASATRRPRWEGSGRHAQLLLNVFEPNKQTLKKERLVKFRVIFFTFESLFPRNNVEINGRRFEDIDKNETPIDRSIVKNSKERNTRRLPAPPGKPILIPGADESQPDVVAIRWERSPSNGGSAIVGYLVEHRRLGSQHWVRSTPGLCTFPELTLSGLEPGWRYQFRIRAQNAVGFSRPSEISDPLTVTLQRSASSAPYFDLEVKDTTVLENEQIRLPRQYEDGLLFEQDETIRLKVSLAGRPPPSVIWYHDGEVVSNDDRHIFETMDGESILKIPDAKRVDRGEYTVKAINKLGEDTSSFLVTVTDRPAAPGKATVTMTLGRSVTLSWEEPRDDGGCKIGTYIVEYYRVGWDVWLKATTSRQTKATLSELIEGSEYKFRVKAENPYGVSEPSEESDVIFIPDIKRGIMAPSLSGKSQSHREIRSREKRENLIQNKEPPATPVSSTNVTVTPPTMEEPNRRSAFRESRSRSVSISRERSMSPLSMPKIQEQHEEEASSSYSPLRPSMNLTLKKQQAIVDEPEPQFVKSHSLDDKLTSPTSPRENDDTVLHGSSEFMLVLYPEDQEKRPEDTVERRKSLETPRITTDITADVTEDIEDLIPPPMSLSLPELFSAEHQVVETLREAVSSTELLHERAMERFYRAVAAEEASEVAKRKVQLERKTGELASTGETKPAIENDVFKRRLSNTAIASPNLMNWQSKKNRRRLSEGQAETVKPANLKLLTSNLLPEVEAVSDPNIPSDSESPIVPSWGLDKPEETTTPLRRWHDTNVPLVEEKPPEESILWQSNSNEDTLRNEGLSPDAETSQSKKETKEETDDEEEESMETSEESSEEISSADSEDLKLLKARILARQVLDEEDTYHPRGRPIPHVEPEPPAVPAHRVPIVDVTPPTPTTTDAPVLLTAVVPKSILKKPKEEPIPVNSFGRPIPPEKPIRKSLPPNVQAVSRNEEEDIVDTQVTAELIKVPAMSESDTDSVLSAGEAAKNRRIQAKARTATPEEEIDEEDIEARMAMVNHYTEIVREHSSRFNYRSSEERKLDNTTGSRRSSFTEDHDPNPEKLNKRQDFRETRPVQQTKVRKGNEVDREEKPQVNKRSTTPARDTKPAKEKRTSRPSSRNQSPVSRSRNVSVERGVSSRSSSKTRARAPSQDRRPPSRTGSEDQRFVRERSVDEGPRRSRKPSSKTPSRSSSRDRSSRPETPVELKMERLQRALESKKYRYSRRGSSAKREYPEKAWRESRLNEERLAIEAKHNVRSMVGYVTDLTLLLAAVYIYLFKKETMAIPFIALLLYRRVSEEIKGRMLEGWWSKRKQ